ncbi:MAG: DNA-binding response regulator [Caulobacter sp.]|nr:DNA-binding response regulator [Caulobacter sp.]
MSGEDRRVLAYGWPVMAAIVTVICIIDVVTIVHEQPGLNPLEPIVWEGSSALVTGLLILAPWALVRWAWRRTVPVWLALSAMIVAAPVYSLAHVFGFLGLRTAAYALAGGHYRYGPLSRAIPYEMSKDVLGYGAGLFLFWLLSRLLAQASASAPPPADPATFDIRDGARVIRVPVADILAVTSAGNYVEFLLADGRKPLMRSALSAVEADLAAGGFVRTHRSWLVNIARVTGLKPEGSGDYAVELSDVTAPLSRRFPDALARLRGD